MRSCISITAAVVLAATPCFGQARPAPPTDSGSVGSPWSSAESDEVGRLGVQLAEMTPELRVFFGAPRAAGVLLTRVFPQSPAAKARVLVGDVVIQIDKVAMTNAAGVRDAVSRKKRGEPVVLTVMRFKRFFQLTARIDSDPPEEDDIGFDWHFGPGEIRDPWKWERTHQVPLSAHAGTER